ncbi:MAG: tetratricopeptide repeat protein [bacterium]
MKKPEPLPSIRFLLVVLFALSPSSIAGQPAAEKVVAGALVYNYHGLERGAAGDLVLARVRFGRALQYMPYFARARLNLRVCTDAARGIIRHSLAVNLFRSLEEFSSDSLRALALANATLNERPDYAPGYLYRARIFEKLGFLDQAESDYDRAVELSAPDVVNHTFRGKLYLRTEQYHKAVAEFTTVIEMDASYAPAFLRRGIAYGSIQDYDRAIDDFEVALAHWPKWRQNFNIFAAYLNRGIENIQKEMYYDAISDLDKAIELNARFSESYLQRGVAHLNLRSYGRAISDLNVAIDREPASAEAYYYRGVALQHKRRLEAAVQDYLQAVALQPGHVQAHYRLGEAYSKQHQLEKAILEFDRVLLLDPEAYWAHYWRAIACDKLHNTRQAILSYKAFLRKAPSKHTRHAQFAKARVKNLTRRTSK